MSRRGSKSADAGTSAGTHPLDSKINEVLGRFDDLEEKMSKLIDDKLDRLEKNLLSIIDKRINKKFVELENKLTGMLDAKVEATETSLKQKLTKIDQIEKRVESKENIKTLVKQTVAEMETKHDRRSNFVVFNVPECKSNLKDEIVKHDRDVLQEIVKV